MKMFLCGSKEAFKEGRLSRVTCPGTVAGETLNFGVSGVWRYLFSPADHDSLHSGFKLELREVNPTLAPFATTLESQVESVTQDRLRSSARHLQRGRSRSPRAALAINRHFHSVIHMAYFSCLPLHEKNYCRELCLRLAKWSPPLVSLWPR